MPYVELQVFHSSSVLFDLVWVTVDVCVGTQAVSVEEDSPDHGAASDY